VVLFHEVRVLRREVEATHYFSDYYFGWVVSAGFLDVLFSTLNIVDIVLGTNRILYINGFEVIVREFEKTYIAYPILVDNKLIGSLWIINAINRASD
jgi:hypothetical protein